MSHSILAHRDSDDIACYRLEGGDGAGSVVVIHDYARPGWETEAEFASYDGWLEFARQIATSYSETKLS